MKHGETINTTYGAGVIQHYRELDGMYVVDMPFGALYANREALQTPEHCIPLTAIKKPKNDTTMELNVAYESLEKMRQLNLEVTCQEQGILFKGDSLSTTCTNPAMQVTSPQYSKTVAFQEFVGWSINSNAVKSGTPCLICSAPACRSHASKTFGGEGITVCLECERLFSMDYVIDCLAAPDKETRRTQIGQMIDLYDRVILLLKYSAQFIATVATSLEETTERQNKVGVGSSSAGMVSGVLGVAAAATIFTPAGPPLLVASLLFGGSATVVQTGTEVRNYYSEPKKLADRIIALHGMVHAILAVTGTLRDALTRDHIRTDMYDGPSSFTAHASRSLAAERQAQAETRAMAGMTAGRAGAAGVELGSLATATEAATVGRSARFFSKTGTGIMRTARFARFAGGALSAATLLLEARALTTTMQHMANGNPCEKADTLRAIQDELLDLPCSTALERECEQYLEAMEKRQHRMTEQEAVELLVETYKAPTPMESGDESLTLSDGEKDPAIACEESASTSVSVPLPKRISLYKEPGHQSPTPGESDETSSYPMNRTSSLSGSLLERIEYFKQRCAGPAGRNKDIDNTADLDTESSTLF
ncbi:predicted protein [Phaeodactylum tricornutum CCAP 1055/1]|uniref:Uncharacterized protein n=2 Tax=Phaeodactylum tricornutum TaxID=2850 RepID=B7G0A1_PHATC|nr:predicted protein [Phaeodactylum tricornutum CCAP 1055/1]EEC48051.1 predicted protein [Phaeodactylum tricornutum CCAP 1055/1]|eukprot:XP_002180643.1 predicted protein [Phaeodactylum tricornutum CCAP 1055/1]